MRTYGRRFARNIRTRQIENARTTQNAIIWTIDEDNRRAGVRIQGSNSEIQAYFPTSWHTRPDWVKSGAPVRILYNRGLRGRVELVGPGVVIPYPQSGNVWPDPPTPENHIISGLELIPIPNNKRLAVMVLVGSCMIGGVEVDFDAISASDTSSFTAGDGGYCGSVAAVFDVTVPISIVYPDHRYIIHNIFANSNGTITMEVGHQFSANKYMVDNGYVYDEDASTEAYFENTEIPIFHENISPQEGPTNILIGSVITWENCTKVEATNIDWIWHDVPYEVYSREPVMLRDGDIGVSLDVIDWGTSECTVHIEAIENTGNRWIVGKFYAIEATLISGTGEIKWSEAADADYGTSDILWNSYSEGVYYPDWYMKVKRDNLVTDISPVIQLKLQTNNEVLSYVQVIYLDAGGNPMQ